MKKLIAGNWKMNCSLEEAKLLIADIVNGLYSHQGLTDQCDFLVCPPFVYLPTIRHATTQFGVMSYGAQDCSHQDNGAFTGDISCEMLHESGCSYVICGHSERREYHMESNVLVNAKAAKAQERNMSAIICVGESEQDRNAGKHVDVVLEQLSESLPAGARSDNTVIAYEPVWAIGSGRTPTSDEIMEMHSAIYTQLKEKLDKPENIRILYGGSVKPENANEILNLEHVHGALIGGASLSADSFLAIAQNI